MKFRNLNFRQEVNTQSDGKPPQTAGGDSVQLIYHGRRSFVQQYPGTLFWANNRGWNRKTNKAVNAG